MNTGSNWRSRSENVVTEAIQERPVAGPEDVFEQGVYVAVERQVKHQDANIDDDVEEVIRLYRHASLDIPTAERPLSWHDQERLRDLIARYDKLRQHPLLPYNEPPESLELAFLKKGWINPSQLTAEDVTPADVMQAFFGVKQRLQRLAIKHGVLRRVRELCRLHQQKWEAGGPLSALDSGSLSQVLEGLIGRHLVLREGDGSLSVHPAVRDYFGQLATASERGFWHHLIGEQLIRLVQRPGLRLPTDQASLDLVEEAITHALHSGESAKALNLYEHVLGGHRHLAWKLGEMARGLRIIRKFSPCPDRWALGWYLRALGEMEKAFGQNNFSFFRADIRLLQGRLTQVEAEGDPARAAIAEFLMGRTTKLPSIPLGCAIPRAQLLLYLGRTGEARLSESQPEQVYEMIGWADDKAHCELYRAETASLIGDETACRQALDAAARWSLHSGSVEHLCLYHLVRSRLLKRAGKTQAAWLAANEGLHIARQSGLGLYLVELLCSRAELLLDRSQAVEAEGPAREALRFASMVDCQFLWGAAQAGHLLGRGAHRARTFGRGTSNSGGDPNAPLEHRRPSGGANRNFDQELVVCLVAIESAWDPNQKTATEPVLREQIGDHGAPGGLSDSSCDSGSSGRLSSLIRRYSRGREIPSKSAARDLFLRAWRNAVSIRRRSTWVRISSSGSMGRGAAEGAKPAPRLPRIEAGKSSGSTKGPLLSGRACA